MMLIENRNYLRLNHRPLFNQLIELESQQTSHVIIEQAKNGSMTMKMNWQDKISYIHSKYNPENEAVRLIANLKELEQYNYVLFIGIGLGYHIEEFIKQYPSITFSIYEPNKEVLLQFFAKKNINDWSVQNIDAIFTGMDEKALLGEVEKLNKVDRKIFIFPLPAYENIYSEEIILLMNSLKETIKNEKNSLAVNAAFQTRWTLNAIKNFPYLLKTPNILHDVDKAAFKEKPAIIVSAGPSLSDEFENLRYIKDHGLAYIFAVGSAVNAVIKQEIYPDAVCTYDPQSINYRVIQIIKDQEIKDVPLIFGSTVGYETLENYPGQMLHMIMSQDTISPYLLNHDEDGKLSILHDAPSIAVVTFELLSKLGVGSIILVGQNLAYLQNRHYAEGISYGDGSEFLPSNRNTLTVKNVYGEEVATNEGFNRMRSQLETYIQMFSQVKVINTTKGGAHIEGTEFMPLEKVMQLFLKGKVVNEDWYKVSNHYQEKYLSLHFKEINAAYQKLENINDRMRAILKNIDHLVKMNKVSNLEKEFNRFDKLFNKMKHNLFYKNFIQSLMKVQNKKMEDCFIKIRAERNATKKGEMVVQELGKFISDVQTYFEFLRPYYTELLELIKEKKGTL